MARSRRRVFPALAEFAVPATEILPGLVVATLLAASGIWWAGAILSWVAWERRFQSPALERARLDSRGEKPGGPDLLDVLGFGIPTVLPIILAMDWFGGSNLLLYNPVLSFPIQSQESFQILGIAFLLIALPTLTWSAYLTARYVYSKDRSERTLLTRGPYRVVRHPIYLAFALVGSGLVLLSQNWLMLPVLILFYEWGWRKEETELEAAFGARYREYRARTGAFFPKIRRRT